ncbi:hypothetical protein VTN77DRAFT_4297 [Rasamsonia byssochlamydoides]|uniref:uncharacterized protein n=1 Tax=Rasamsonia byssochlamydoides TaxID=89139 RepID=UPI003742F371
MPGRKVNLRGPKDEVARKPKPSKKSRGGLDALAIAEDQFPERTKIRRNRLGEINDFSKRKRPGQDGEGPDTKRLRTENETSDFSENGGSDSEGHEWKIGEVNSEDDSELDSDEAMGSSDEERFEGFTFRGSSSGKKSKAKRASASTKRNREMDLSEDVVDEGGSSEDDEEDDLGEDAVDLATAWDMNASDDEVPDKSSKLNKDSTSDSETDGSNDDDDDDDDDDDLSEDTDLSISDDDGDAETQSGLSKLQSFVNSMETTTAGKSSQKANRGQENRVPTEYGLTSTRKLTVADLIPSVTDSRLKSSLKHLSSTAKSKSSGVPGKLAAPLPKRQQDRLERAAAYEKSKETLDRWIETVKANRRAEHLSFPLPDPEVQQLPRIGPVKPQTDLENTIQTILVESGLAESNEKSAEEQIQKAEELEARKLSLEEVRARTAELRKRRELLFREEVRAKRIKKIKSKSYRRIHRKEREKMAQLERQALIEAGIDLDEEEREQNDRRRAEARVGAKHKESKWAKSLKQTGRAAWDEDARLSMADMARRDEELRKRIEGKRVSNADEDFLGSSSSESEDDRDPWDEEDSEAEARKLREDLDALDREDDATNITGPHSKLMSMKFMQNAEAARKRQNDEEIKKLRRELNGDESEPEEVEGGRKKFGGSKAESSQQPVVSRSRNEFEEAPSSEDEELDIPESTTRNAQTAANHTGDQKAKPAAQPANGSKATIRKEDDPPEENPWLTQTTRNNRKRSAGNTDQSVTISVNGQSEISTVDPKPAPRKDSSHDEATTHQPRQSGDQDDDASESDDDAHTPILLKNHDLVKKAFAGDEVVADFEKEKLETIEEEGDKVIDNTLPGWGSWTGAGISKKQQKRQKRFLTTIEGVKPEQRKDAKLDRVIINEKRVKKNIKYLATQLPHPFESKQQYERSLRLPIGPEWTTKETFQDATKPRVMIKQGIIKPMEKPMI